MATAGARYTRVTSRKWQDRWYLDLTPQQRNLFDYFVENGDGTAAGVYQCDLDVARMKTKPWRGDAFERTCHEYFPGHVLFYEEGWVFVVQYLRHNGDNMNPLFAQGIETFLQQAPPQAQADFWKVYGKDARLNKFGVPSPSSLEGLPKPFVTPSRTNPGRTNPSRTNTYSPSAKPPDPRVKEAQTYFFERLQKHTGLEVPVFSWPQSGKFYRQRLIEADDSLDDLRDTTDEFFDRYIRGDKSAANFGHYQRVYNALCIAVQKRRKGASTQ